MLKNKNLKIHKFYTDKEIELIDLSEMKANFVADCLHELKTPLAIIKGNVDLGLKDKSNSIDNLKETLRAIDIEIKYLIPLLSDLTQLNFKADKLIKRKSREKIAGKINLKKVKLFEILSGVIGRTKTLAQKKGISIKTSSTFPNTVIMGDKICLEKLFINIINNAILYGRKNGKIIISSSKVGKNIIVNIKDNGIGISPKDLPNVFNRYYRVNDDYISEGTGIGLSIAKWITEAHAGKIKIESSKGKETTFSMYFPIVSEF